MNRYKVWYSNEKWATTCSVDADYESLDKHGNLCFHLHNHKEGSSGIFRIFQASYWDSWEFECSLVPEPKPVEADESSPVHFEKRISG